MSLSVSDWYQLKTALAVPLSNYYPVYDNQQTLYLTGGIKYDDLESMESTSSQNSVYSVEFNLTANTLISNIEDVTSDFYTLFLNVVEEEIVASKNNQMIDNGAGFYDNKIFYYGQEYSGDANTLYMTVCNVTSGLCRKDSLLDDGSFDIYFQPCIVQNGKFLYIIGGTYSYQVSNDILVELALFQKRINYISTDYHCPWLHLEQFLFFLILQSG